MLFRYVLHHCRCLLQVRDSIFIYVNRSKYKHQMHLSSHFFVHNWTPLSPCQTRWKSWWVVVKQGEKARTQQSNDGSMFSPKDQDWFNQKRITVPSVNMGNMTRHQHHWILLKGCSSLAMNELIVLSHLYPVDTDIETWCQIFQQKLVCWDTLCEALTNGARAERLLRIEFPPCWLYFHRLMIEKAVSCGVRVFDAV